jgi:RNA polymerase sigma-70 factor (ECF subfamily)
MSQRVPGSLIDEVALELLRRIAQNDEKAFVELFCAINRRVFLFAMRRLGNRQDAEEVLNDTALELWRYPDRFRSESRFMTYVLGIAYHKSGSLLRHRVRCEETAQDDVDQVPDDDPTPFEVVWGAEKLAAIARCMERLSERQRIVVHLAYFEDLSREEIGRIIDCEGNAVRQHLWQALRKMKPCLEKSGLE